VAHRLHSLGVETSIRFSLRTGDRAFDENGRDVFLDAIASLPIDYLDASSGFYSLDKRLIYPSLASIRAARRLETLLLAARHVGVHFIFSGGLADELEAQLPANIHIGICRDLIANPNHLNDPSNGCVTSMKCHYFSRGEAHLTCSRWADRQRVPQIAWQIDE
jgi:hypothetical protein